MKIGGIHVLPTLLVVHVLLLFRAGRDGILFGDELV